MKSALNLCATVLLLVQNSAVLPQEWTHWRWFRPVEASPAGASQLVKTTLPPEVYGKTLSGLADIRVIDESGAEVPYFIESRPGRDSQQWLNVAVQEVSHVPGAYTQVLLDLGPAGQVHDQAVINVDPTAGQFDARVEIAVSDNGRDFRLLRGSEPIYRFVQQGTHLEVAYDNTTARWLRFRIRDEKGGSPTKLPVAGVQVGMHVVDVPERLELPIASQTRPDGPQGESWWQLDLGTPRVPAVQVRFTTATPSFYREVRVFASDDARTWRRAITGFIFRGAVSRPVNAFSTQPESGNTENLAVLFPENSGRFWRIIVNDGDSPPLSDAQLSLWGVPRHVLFRQEPQHAYRLLYGNDFSKEPVYDLQRLVSRDETTAVREVGLGMEQNNAAWADPRPWSEQYPIVLWFALSVAIGVLAWLAIRTMRQTPATKF